MAKKNYVLDTNIFVFEPNCLFMFEDNDLFISPVTLRELNGLKNQDGEVGYSARRARNLLDELRNSCGSISDGIPLGEGLGKLSVIPDVDFTDFKPGMTRTQPDDFVLAAAAWKAKNNDGRETVLVTDDIDLRFLADLIGVQSQPFKSRMAKDKDLEYSGRQDLTVSHAAMEEFLKKGYTDPDAGAVPEVNEFLILRDAETGRTALARFDGQKIRSLAYLTDEKGNPLLPSGVVTKNTGQRFMQEALLAPAEEIPLVIVRGPVGTAKTFMTLACALEQVIGSYSGSYARILITRANVDMDKTYGSLPGTESEKVGPMMRPFLDNLHALLGKPGSKYEKDGKLCPDPVEYLFDRGIVKAEAMQYMRGRSITDTFVIIDEVQNCTPNQILSIVSRIGAGSKIVLLGDPEQIDNRLLNKRNNGLVFAAKRFKGSKLCCQIRMSQSECVRSPLAAEAAIRLANEYGNL